jgi:predicted GNAT family acetyltransferase
MTGAVEILHDPGNGRFEAMVDGHRCELVYHLAEGLMSIVHTGVPSDVGGRGIAAQLVAAAFATARARGWKVRPGRRGRPAVLTRRRGRVLQGRTLNDGFSSRVPSSRSTA